ncbi:hypothetical protein L195_g064739, partial [Trifolium pratense]
KVRQILLCGCRWQIGSGDMIRVMYDPWLRGNGDRWVSSPQAEGVCPHLKHHSVDPIADHRLI